MTTETKQLSKCVFCNGAMFVGYYHLCHPHDPILIVASKYGYNYDQYDFPAMSQEFYEVRAAARLEIIKERIKAEKNKQKHRNLKPVCRCKMCRQTPGFHRIVMKDGFRVRYRTGGHDEPTP